MREWNSDFGISQNESLVKVGETEERLNIFDLSGFRPILDYLDLVRCHGEAFRCQDSLLGLLVFAGVWMSASACALCLPTNSVQVFRGW